MSSPSDLHKPVRECFPKGVFVKSNNAPVVDQQSKQRDWKDVEPAVGDPVPDTKSNKNQIGQQKSE